MTVPNQRQNRNIGRRAPAPPQAHANPSPVPGLVTIAAGTAIAIALVPDYVTPAGALFESAVAMTVGLLLPVALRLRLDLTHVLRIENILLIGLVYWILLDLLQSAYPIELVGKSDVELTFLSTGLFALGVWLGAAGRGWPLPGMVRRASSLELSQKTIFNAALLCFALGMLKFAVPSGFDPFVMLAGLGVSRWSAPWTRSDFGGSEAIVEHLQYFGYIMPSLTVILAQRSGWVKPSTLIAIVLSVVMTLFLSQSGGRRIVGVTAGAGLFTWLILQRVLKPKIVFGSILGVGGLLVAMQEMLRFRNVGFGAWLAGETPELAVSHLHVDDNFLRMSQIINLFPSLHDFVYFQPLYHALSLPIPRFLWPGKPSDPGFSLPDLLGKEGVSLSSSMIGELYASFGLPAIFAGALVLGRLAGMWNKCLRLTSGDGRALMFSLGLMAMFAGLRSVQALVQMSYIVLAWIAISHFLKPRNGAT